MDNLGTKTKEQLFILLVGANGFITGKRRWSWMCCVSANHSTNHDLPFSTRVTESSLFGQRRTRPTVSGVLPSPIISCFEMTSILESQDLSFYRPTLNVQVLVLTIKCTFSLSLLLISMYTHKHTLTETAHTFLSLLLLLLSTGVKFVNFMEGDVHSQV